ncbi:c-type cytochrome [Paenalcaligenes sp. Me52]|uniref:cytochrome c n=1 Tax=Paenalcaligenes sp. Me52 TaxID=3392038 RepID=UPI003D2B4B8E
MYTVVPGNQAVTVETRTVALPALEHALYGAVVYPPLSLLQQPLLANHQPLYSDVDWSAAQKVPGVVKCVAQQNFLAVLAAQETTAKQAKALVRVSWVGAASQAPAFNDAEGYSWDASVDNGLAWSVAQYEHETLHVWLSTAYPHQLRDELMVLASLPAERIQIYQSVEPLTEAYDEAVQAAVLALQVKQPVVMRAESGLQTIKLVSLASESGAWESNVVPGLGTSVAAKLLGWQTKDKQGVQLATEYVGDRRYNHAQWLAPVGAQRDYAAALTFAAESDFDESLRTHGVDPLQERLVQVQDERGRRLIQRAAEQAGWVNDDGIAYTPKKQNHGYGFAYVKAYDYEQKPAQAVWSAWAVELALDTQSQQLSLQKVTVAFDSDQHIPQSDVQQTQIKHRISQWAGKLLGHSAGLEERAAQASDSTSSPQPVGTDIQVVNQSALVGQALAWSATAELPAAAAIANAVKDATQVRLHHAPLDLSLATQRWAIATQAKAKSSKRWLGWLAGAASAAAGLLVVASPWRPAIPPVPRIDTSIFSDIAIERGRLVALAGDCMVCHTADGQATNAGGLALDTPFGKIFTTNITPDPETGIGAWSYKAFERAMRDGIHRDGSHLYPAFPYTSYAKLSDEDLQSLYAYLMTQEPVHAPNKPHELGFPFNFRPALAGWNTLFHTDRQAYQYDEGQTELWNRGAYLVNSSGHCMACHSPRNSLGGEKKGKYFLAGGEVDGWEAPALNALATADVPWTEEALYTYLRTGQSVQHGVAAGPMGPIIEGLAELPEYDVRAMSHYLLNLQGRAESVAAEPQIAAANVQLQQVEQQAQTQLTDVWLMPGRSIYEGACMVCHDSQSGPALFGARPSLAVNTSIQSDSPDNLIQVILHGITRPSSPALGNMPAFKHSLNNQQMEDLLHYLRKQYAPDKKPWENIQTKVQSIRQQPGHL